MPAKRLHAFRTCSLTGKLAGLTKGAKKIRRQQKYLHIISGKDAQGLGRKREGREDRKKDIAKNLRGQ
eukprot:51640-Pelagomonas_calceolata.AAC.1